MAAGRDPLVSFGPFQLDVRQRRLQVGGRDVPVGGRGMDVLLALAARQGTVVDRETLMQAGWPDTIVDPSNLKVTVAQLRRALRLHAPGRDFIHNVVGRGYWLGAGEEGGAAPVAGGASLPPCPDLLGRDADLAQLEALVASHRLVTIVGPGGIGKTALAIAFAHRHAAGQFHDVKFVDLSGVRAEEYVAPSLASALGVSSGGDSLQSLYSILAPAKMLLVIDTCEHVLQAVAHLCDVLLSRTQNVAILATSRQVLRARGERLLWLSPLAIPPSNGADRLEAVLDFAAPRLLARRAAEAGSFACADSDAVALVQICREVEGSPLAIELVAPRLAAVGAQPTLAELDRGLMELRRPAAEGPRRQRTLWDTLRWSYSLLSEQEAAALRAVSVFAGSFTADWAIRVTQDGPVDALDLVDALSGLRSKSMVSAELHGTEPHYRLLDSTREFAESMRDETGEESGLRGAHARWVLDRLAASASDRATQSHADWRRNHGSLIHELRRAVDWALRRAADPALGIRLVAASLPLLHQLSLNQEISTLCDLALAEFQRLGSTDRALELSLMVGRATVSTYIAADSARVADLFNHAARLARITGDVEAECRVLGAYAAFDLLTGKTGHVAGTLSAMKSAARRSGLPPAAWEEQQLRAQYEIRIRRFDRALERVLALAKDMGRETERAAPTFQIHQRMNVATQLAALYWLTGKPGQAIETATLAAKLVATADHGLTIVHSLAQGVVWTLFQCGEYAAVLPHVETLREAIYRHGIAAWIPVADTYATVADAYLGHAPEPARLRSAFYGVRAGAPQIRHEARYTLIADAMIANRQWDDAGEVITHVLAALPDPWCKAELLRLEAAVERHRGRVRRADELLDAAWKAARASGSPAWMLRAAIDLAAARQAQGRPAQALEILGPVCQRFEGGFETGDVRRARERMASLSAMTAMTCGEPADPGGP